MVFVFFFCPNQKWLEVLDKIRKLVSDIQCQMERIFKWSYNLITSNEKSFSGDEKYELFSLKKKYFSLSIILQFETKRPPPLCHNPPPSDSLKIQTKCREARGSSCG